MGRIDVSQLLSDPNFVDAISVITRTPSVNGQGENAVSDSTLETVGSVQPATGKALTRLPEGLQNADVMSFWFRGQIIATEPGKYSSVLVFKGFRYQVKTVFDWSTWGAGWTEGLCVAEKPS